MGRFDRPDRSHSVLAIVAFGWLLSSWSRAQSQIEFLTGEQARLAIVDESIDPFFSQLSIIDVEARLGEPLGQLPMDEGKDRLRQRFRNAVIDWPTGTTQSIERSCQEIAAASARLAPAFIPSRWRFVLTDGSEEQAAAYTRGDTIILPIQKVQNLANSPGSMNRLVAHETCHVYGRLHPKTRSRLLQQLGFRVVAPIRLGAAVEARKLTNPDAPVIDGVIKIEPTPGVEVEAALILYAEPARFSPAVGPGVFRYLKFGLVAVADVGDGEYEVIGGNDAIPAVYSPDAVQGFFEKVGRNTRYVVSPDEILADNIAMGLAPASGPLPSNPTLPADLLEIIRTSDESSIAPAR
jgi:hypothetical protein